MKTTCYLQVMPEFSRGGHLRSASAVRITQGKPHQPIGGALLVKLTLDIDDKAFMPLQPVVEVVIPAHHTEAIQVESEELEVPA